MGSIYFKGYVWLRFDKVDTISGKERVTEKILRNRFGFIGPILGPWFCGNPSRAQTTEFSAIILKIMKIIERHMLSELTAISQFATCLNGSIWPTTKSFRIVGGLRVTISF